MSGVVNVAFYIGGGECQGWWMSGWWMSHNLIFGPFRMRMFCMFPHVAASAWPIGHPYTRTWLCCDQELFWETEYFSLRITAEILRKMFTVEQKNQYDHCDQPIFKIVIATVNEIFRGSSSRLFQLLSPLVWTVFPGSSIKLCWSQSSDFPDKQSIMSAGKFIKYSLYCVNFSNRPQT